MNKTEWLAEFFENLGRMFEKFNPAAFRFLAAILPYSTPFPVAWLTMRSAEAFLGFTPSVAFTFVFGLEGMGLWFTSLFVDSIIDVIKSRNTKTIVLVVLFGLVVVAYVSLLVNLNVTLKSTTGESNPALERVITLLCFLPLLTGVGNGYYKWKLEQNDKEVKREELATSTANQIRQERREDRLKAKMIDKGMNPMAPQLTQYQTISQSPLPQPEPQRKNDWRLLGYEERRKVKYGMSVKEIVSIYGVSRATAYNWKSDESKYPL